MSEHDTDDGPYIHMKKNYPDVEKPTGGPENRFDNWLPWISFAVFLSVLFGNLSSLPGEGAQTKLLAIFVAALAGGLSYIANKSAFHTGAKLAASGDSWAIVLVVGWFALMGVTVGTIGFAGVSHEIVEAEKLRAPVRHMAQASREVGEAAAEAKRIVPLISAGQSDIAGIAACEATAGCVSGRRGRGPTVARLEGLAGRFKSIERIYDRAEKRRSELVAKLETLTGKYEAQLSEGGVAGGNRAKLVAIYSQAQSLVTEIANVVPTAAAQGLVSELRAMPAPAAKPGRIDVGARLRGHADRLEEALQATSSVKVALPPFPSPSGLTVGWQRLDLTAPLAVLLFGLEAILVVLWSLLVRDFIARRRSAGLSPDQPEPPQASASAPMDLDAPASDHDARSVANGQDRLPLDHSTSPTSRPRRG